MREHTVRVVLTLHEIGLKRKAPKESIHSRYDLSDRFMQTEVHGAEEYAIGVRGADAEKDNGKASKKTQPECSKSRCTMNSLVGDLKQ